MPKLAQLWLDSLPAVRRYGPAPAEAALYWGKAASMAWRTLGRRSLDPWRTLVISPTPAPALAARAVWVPGGHPLPDSASFAAGERLLGFFDALGRSGARRLDVYLSGGASSLAWVPPAHVTRDDLVAKLSGFYARGLDIRALNSLRTPLDALKGGGGASLLHDFAPRVHARVHVVSDVLPFGPEVVGSGPFWDGRVPHRVWADNAHWVRELGVLARAQGLRVSHAESGRLGPWQDWVEALTRQIHAALATGRQGVIIVGGEPQVRLAEGAGQGGRQTQIAAALAPRLKSALLAGRLEILCASSDGLDGRSGAAGAFLDARVARKLLLSRTRLRAALGAFDSASSLRAAGGLVPARETGTNVQDVVLARLL